jgi:hypothetical protein
MVYKLKTNWKSLIQLPSTCQGSRMREWVNYHSHIVSRFLSAGVTTLLKYFIIFLSLLLIKLAPENFYAAKLLHDCHFIRFIMLA